MRDLPWVITCTKKLGTNTNTKTLSHTFMVIRFDTMKGINPSINRYNLLDLLHEYADKWIFKRLKPKLMQTNVLVILKAHNYTLYDNVF